MLRYSTIVAFRSANIAFSQMTFAERKTTLKEQWAEEHEAWSKRNLSDKHYVYVWAHPIYPKVQLEDDANQKQCMLVLIGATPEGKKELITAQDGYRESKQSCRELLRKLKNRGLQVDPKLAIGDGALGFWAACAKSSLELVSRVAGFTRRPICSTRCPRAFDPKRNRTFTTSGKRRRKTKRSKRSICSSASQWIDKRRRCPAV